MKKGAGVLRDPKQRHVRALKMLDFKISTGATQLDVAKEFGVSEQTVHRALSYARKAELVTTIEDKILQDLVPAAHKAILTALKDTENPIESAKIALEVFKGALPGFNRKTGPVASASGGSEDELARYIRELRGGDGQLTLDGEVSESPQRALPAAASSDHPEGISEPDRGNADRPTPPAERPSSVVEGVLEGTPHDSKD